MVKNKMSRFYMVHCVARPALTSSSLGDAASPGNVTVWRALYDVFSYRSLDGACGRCCWSNRSTHTHLWHHLPASHVSNC